MQAILDYERKHHLPESWLNFAFRYSSPNGYWQRLERGEIKLDADFFKGFTADLQNEQAWQEFHRSFKNEKKKLKDKANPTRLGDHTSLKAETANSSPTDQDKGASSSNPNNGKSSPSPSLSKLAKDTTIGDPVSLESEEVVVNSQPEKKHSSNNNNNNINSSSSGSSRTTTTTTTSTPPSVDGESLFWTMMSTSRHPDPYIYPALLRLQSDPNRPILAALSNTVTFPPSHPYSNPDNTSFNPAAIFDIYISSSTVGLRKPSREIYDLTMERINEFAARRDSEEGGGGGGGGVGGSGGIVEAPEVVFFG